MATVQATLVAVNQQGAGVTAVVDYTKISDSSLIEERSFVYHDAQNLTGTQIVNDIKTVGSVYANALSKTTTLQTFIGTSIQI